MFYVLLLHNLYKYLVILFSLGKSPRITLTLTYIVKVMTLSNIQKILVGARCLFKSYK